MSSLIHSTVAYFKPRFSSSTTRDIYIIHTRIQCLRSKLLHCMNLHYRWTTRNLSIITTKKMRLSHLNINSKLHATRKSEGPSCQRIFHIAQYEQVKEKPADCFNHLIIQFSLRFISIVLNWEQKLLIIQINAN